MEAGRQRNIKTKMHGCHNQDNKLTDLYLPRKCDYTDRLINPKDSSSVQLTVCDVFFYLFQINPDGTINLAKNNVVTICGYVRSSGEADLALDKVLREKQVVA